MVVLFTQILSMLELAGVWGMLIGESEGYAFLSICCGKASPLGILALNGLE